MVTHRQTSMQIGRRVPAKCALPFCTAHRAHAVHVSTHQPATSHAGLSTDNFGAKCTARVMQAFWVCRGCLSAPYSIMPWGNLVKTRTSRLGVGLLDGQHSGDTSMTGTNILTVSIIFSMHFTDMNFSYWIPDSQDCIRSSYLLYCNYYQITVIMVSSF